MKDQITRALSAGFETAVIPVLVVPGQPDEKPVHDHNIPIGNAAPEEAEWVAIR